MSAHSSDISGSQWALLRACEDLPRGRCREVGATRREEVCEEVDECLRNCGCPLLDHRLTRALCAIASEAMGRGTLDSIQNALKAAMLTNALSATDGNFSRAAKLLGMTRQAVQQMATRYGLRRPQTQNGSQ